MKVLTKQEVIRKIENFCKPYVSYAKAAEALGVTSAQLSDARRDKAPVPPAILERLGITRQPIYTVDVEGKYLDGALDL